jgi:hypothetical protein
LTAQHVLNAITEHFGNLRISFDEPDSPGVYKVVMNCVTNMLEKSTGRWADEQFQSENYKNLLKAEEIANVCEHAINAALNSARHYRIDARAVREMGADFLLGVTCPAERNEHLYLYRMESKMDNGLLKVFVLKQEIKHGEIAVLGMREKFEKGAREAFSDSLKRRESPAENVFSFLNTAIDEISADGSFLIDRPAFLKEFESGKLKLVKKSLRD